MLMRGGRSRGGSPWPLVLSEEVVLAIRLAHTERQLGVSLNLQSHVEALSSDLKLDLGIMAMVGAACWLQSTGGDARQGGGEAAIASLADACYQVLVNLSTVHFLLPMPCSRSWCCVQASDPRIRSSDAIRSSRGRSCTSICCQPALNRA